LGAERLIRAGIFFLLLVGLTVLSAWAMVELNSSKIKFVLMVKNK
jgi:hypothetical protein